MNLSSTAFLVFALSSCATQDQVSKLEARVAEMEKKVAAGPAAGGAAQGGTKAPPAGDPVKEEEARKLYSEIQELVGKGDFEGAKTKMADLNAKYPDTTTARRGQSLQDELNVVGKEAPTEIKVEKWFQGENDVDIKSGPTLLVFWEVWCPHCKREVPKLQETYAKYHSKGLQMVGLTKINKSSTEEKVQEFLTTEKVSYPIAKETGEMSEYFAVRGIPAAAVVKDGKVVWRGHPARLTDEMINGWL